MPDHASHLPLRLIASQRTLILATASPAPWAAPVYYLYANRRFYFFSNPASRHIEAALAQGQCAGCIFRDSEDWRAIEGLQMEGKIEPVLIGVEAIEAFTAYVARFPTVNDFFAELPFGLDAFKQRFNAEFYAFLPSRVFYLNNRAGFASRREVHLAPAAP